MQEDINYPKVLILSGYNLSGNNAGDITLRSIFINWPKDKLLIVTTSETNSPFADTIFLNNNLINRIRKFTLSLLFKKSNDNKNIVPGTILNSNKNKNNKKSILYSIGAAYFDLVQLTISKADKTRIKQFKPDLIYSLLGNIKIINFSIYLSKKYNIFIIPHFMDDWPTVRYTGSSWLTLPRYFLLKSLQKLFDSVNFGLCISDKMCVEYERRYKIKFFSLMNLITEENVSIRVFNNSNKENIIILAYFGGLHLNRWKTIKKIDESITSVSKKINKEIKLYLYTSNENRNIYSNSFSSNVVFKGEINHEFVLDEMRKCDYLIHIESFDLDVLPYIEYSISTKIPEYFASQRPIIAIGPANSASIEYIKSNNCGFLIYSDQIEEIEKELQIALLQMKNHEYVENALNTVIRNHTQQKIAFMVKLFSELKRHNKK